MKKLRERCLRIPRFSRPVRVCRNLLLVLLAAGMVWMAKGFPCLRMEDTFRRMEQSGLLPKSEILGHVQNVTTIYSGKGQWPVSGRCECHTVFGQRNGEALYIGYLWRSGGLWYPLSDYDLLVSPISVTPIENHMAVSLLGWDVQPSDVSLPSAPVVLVYCDLPGVASADVTAEVGEKTYSAGADAGENGVFLLPIADAHEAEDTHEAFDIIQDELLWERRYYCSREIEIRLSVTVYDGTGAPLGQRTLTYEMAADHP